MANKESQPTCDITGFVHAETRSLNIHADAQTQGNRRGELPEIDYIQLIHQREEIIRELLG